MTRSKLILIVWLGLGLSAIISSCGDEKKAKVMLDETNVDYAGLNFIRDALKSGNKEIAAGELAAKRATNPRVKGFASMMVHDHRESAQALIKICDKKLVTPSTVLVPEDRKTLDSLSKLSAGDFDRAYMRMMVKDHQLAVSIFKRGVNDRINPVQAYAKKQLPVMQMHLDSATRINADLH